MAGGAIAPSSSKAYPGNLTCKVLVTCIVAAMGGLIFGYDIGISGGVTSMAPFLKRFFPELGRKLSMLLGGLLFCCGAIVNGFAQNVAMLIIGRLLLGCGIGFANQSVPLYLSEMAPYRHRGALNIVLPALLFIIGSLILPDTPNSLIERGKPEEAKERLRSIRGIDNVDEEYNDLVAASEASRKVEHPWTNLAQRKYRPQLTFAILIPFFQQLTGMNVFMFYAPVLFKTIGFGDNASLMSAMITGIVNCVATLVSIILVDKVGRRKLFLEGGTQMFICQIVVTVAIALKFGTQGNPGTLPKEYAYFLVILICTFIAGFAWSWGPLGWLVPSEIFPLEIRSAAQSINVSVNMIFTFFVAEIFLQMLCSFKFGLFMFFGAFVLIMTIFIKLFLPETKGIPIEEMTSVWREHWYWKRFVPDSEPSIQMGKRDPSY
ncbi:hypothetical protein F0562_013297 [Nyssa sinensis]|uniref:Major facilitator superfamily (MFS) profile domain-containing protein n=1 Tax=Nyssa sinensis TaxID=561372 RepID=A0A5J4ZY25_9ASTE|nr:hypothetical protein F0562_013297 [Nyssa sinensis]